MCPREWYTHDLNCKPSKNLSAHTFICLYPHLCVCVQFYLNGGQGKKALWVLLGQSKHSFGSCLLKIIKVMTTNKQKPWPHVLPFCAQLSVSGQSWTRPECGAKDKVSNMLLLKCCFTSTETVGLLGTGAQDVHLDFHTAPELWSNKSQAKPFYINNLYGVNSTLV